MLGAGVFSEPSGYRRMIACIWLLIYRRCTFKEPTCAESTSAVAVGARAPSTPPGPAAGGIAVGKAPRQRRTVVVDVLSVLFSSLPSTHLLTMGKTEEEKAAKKAAKKAEKQAEREFARSEQDRVRKLNEEDAAERAGRRAVEVETQEVVLNQIRSKYGIDDTVDESAGRASRATSRASAQPKPSFKELRASREGLILRTKSKLAEGSPNDTFIKPPPGVRPQRN